MVDAQFTKKEITHPFHIHIDATILPDALEIYAKQVFGFVEADFAGHPEGYRHFEPNRHLTLKVQTKQERVRVERDLEQKSIELGLVGYIEVEYVLSDIVISDINSKEPSKPFDPNVPLSFQINRRLLRGPDVNEEFRETEFHLLLDKDASDPRLIRALLDGGLYGAYLKKYDAFGTPYTAIVLTAQGFARDIEPLTVALFWYVQEAGGAARCTLQEERAIGHKLIGIRPDKLPEIVDRLTTSNDIRDRTASVIKLMRDRCSTTPQSQPKSIRLQI